MTFLLISGQFLTFYIFQQSFQKVLFCWRYNWSLRLQFLQFICSFPYRVSFIEQFFGNKGCMAPYDILSAPRENPIVKPIGNNSMNTRCCQCDSDIRSVFLSYFSPNNRTCLSLRSELKNGPDNPRLELINLNDFMPFFDRYIPVSERRFSKEPSCILGARCHLLFHIFTSIFVIHFG